MKRIGLAIGLLAAGCATSDETPAETGARESFEQWNRAIAEGDVDASYKGLSDGRKSDWLYDLMKPPSDDVTQAHLALLEPELRDILEAWFRFSEKNLSQLQRPRVLPVSILASRWLPDLYRKIFEQGGQKNATQANRREVKSVAGDGGGMTVLTHVEGNQEMWGLKWEGDRWKVDLYKSLPNR